MLQKYKTKREEGFTIIEVLIVLAIAGLIILIVFLAVPALKRNSRNTQRRNDVSAILGAVQEFANNNGGKLPADGDATTGDMQTVYNNAKLGFYKEAANVTIGDSDPTITDEDIQLDTVAIIRGATCSSATAVDVTNGSERQYVVKFWVETSGSPQAQCQQS